jgi:hypothetical protein
MSNPLPFHPPAPVAYDAVGQPVFRQPVAPPLKKTDLECDNCGQPFYEGEPAVELFLGAVGVGEKSGRPMVVDDPTVEHPEIVRTWIVHPQCVVEMTEHAICDWGDDAKLCANCEQKLTGDED